MNNLNKKELRKIEEKYSDLDDEKAKKRELRKRPKMKVEGAKLKEIPRIQEKRKE